MLPFSLVVILVAALASPSTAEDNSACSLLTPADIESVSGGKVSGSQPLQFDDIQSGPNRIVKVSGCMWSLPNHQAQITMSWFHGPFTDEEIAQLIKMTKDNVGTNALRKANYKEVAKDFSKAWCSVMTPPASDKGGMPLSSCVGGVKGHGISLSVMSPTKPLTIDQTKALLDKTASHLR